MTYSNRSKPALLDSPLFRSVGYETRAEKILNELGFVLRTYSSHRHITEQGNKEERVFVVQSGWGCIYKGLPDGERQIIDFTLAGDIIGLRTGNMEAQGSFVAITDLLVFETRVKTVLSALARYEGLAEILCSAVSRQNAILTEHLANLGRRSALVRTAHLLLELRERLQLAQAADENGYECPLTQYDLADALGLTAIHVNRMLRELREFGFLSFRKGRVEFLDPRGLTEFAQFDGSYIRQDVQLLRE